MALRRFYDKDIERGVSILTNYGEHISAILVRLRAARNINDAERTDVLHEKLRECIDDIAELTASMKRCVHEIPLEETN